MIACSAPPPGVRLGDPAHRMGEERPVEPLGAVRDREDEDRRERDDRRDETLRRPAPTRTGRPRGGALRRPPRRPSGRPDSRSTKKTRKSARPWNGVTAKTSSESSQAGDRNGDEHRPGQPRVLSMPSPPMGDALKRWSRHTTAPAGMARWEIARAPKFTMQRDDEQHQARGDQRAEADLAGVAVLVGDVGRDRVAARGEDLPDDLEVARQHQSDGDRLAERAAEAEHRGAGDTGLAERAAPTCGSFPSGSRPSASAASRWVCGTCRKTSREMAAMIGRIMTASTRDAAKTDFPKPPSVPRIGIQPKYVVSHFESGMRCGTRKIRPQRP